MAATSRFAVDPNDANHVVIAYQNTPGANQSGIVQLIVAESTDGGVTWATKFTTSAATRSGQPALAIQTDGTIGFLYDNYDPATNTLSQHLLQTDDDFVTVDDLVLAAESNATPSAVFSPYLGDFFDLTAIGNTFYGVFSASNADNGTDAQFINVDWQRMFTGTPGAADFQLTDSNGNPVAASIDPFFFIAGTPCFVRGTRIRTTTGDVPVEALTIGDSVVTAAGAERPVKWVGKRAYDARFVAGNKGVLPIQIAAGALADGVPAHDLFVSPEHAMVVDGRFLPARLLINGTTISQVDAVESLEYFHLELDSHDVIFAEGAAAESFADFGGRAMFHNSAEFARLYPDAAPADWEAYAALLADGEAALPAIRAALLKRAEALGQVSRDPDLHVILNGRIMRPESVDGREHRFILPPGAGEVTIASRSVVPLQTEAASLDPRRLGVPVEHITLAGGGLRLELGPDCGLLTAGFHHDEGSHRWTDGAGRLPAELLAGFTEPFVLEARIGATALHYPVAPRTSARRHAAAAAASQGLALRA